MSFDWSFKDYFNLSKKIPLCYQKRYLANISNSSFLTGVYKNKIKKLLENNKLLALALQNDRAQKEELLAESKANADLVLFSRLKLATMSENLKAAVSVLDEALSLLQMHSSSSISKFTPKNTVIREEFKEQIKGVTMAAIPEEIEIPEEKSTKGNSIDVHKNTKDSVYHSPFSKGTSNQQSLNNIEQKVCGKKSINENSRQIKIREERISPIKKDVSLNDKISKGSNSLLLKTKRNRNNCIRKRNQKAASQASKFIKRNLDKNLDKTPEKLQFKDISQTEVALESSPEKLNCVDNSTEKTVLLKSDSMSINPVQKPLCEDISEEQKNKKNLKCEISSKSSKSNNKKIYEAHNAINNSNIEKSSFEESLKNNSHEKQLLNAVQENSLNKDLKKHNTKKTALKSISSKINIENLKLEKMKQKSVCPLDALTLKEMDEKQIKKRKSVYPLDDLTFAVMAEKDIVKKRKSNNPVFKNIRKSISRKKVLNENISPVSETSILSTDSILQSDSTLREKEKMVKNLAKNTFLVSAEVHKIPPVVSGIRPKTDNMQPVVLVNDVFEASKSLCKSISSLPVNHANEISLEKQLLQHCSSLKIIAENSLNTQNKNSIYTDSGIGRSVVQDKDEYSPKTVLNTEPPLLVDGEIDEKQMYEDKKTLRKKPSISYREPPINVKLRREKF